jgi:hypothetical protein
MTTILTNNIISNLTSSYYIDTSIELNNTNVYQVDIKTIVSNAKTDKRFHKLLSLCIKYDIHLFNQYRDACTLLSINNLIYQTNQKQKLLTLELSEKIREITSSDQSIHNEWLINIDTIYIQYKKKFKDLELILYDLKNLYTDVSLIKICCIEQIHNITSNLENVEQNSNTPSSSNISLTTKNIIETNKKKEKVSKYIAVYSN